ncbi:MAG: hypothetical protein FWC72_05755, partial [Oscillospiraceae bacterium]|nr:hypothetical protein [Oscillospiraceae bacterium]
MTTNNLNRGENTLKFLFDSVVIFVFLAFVVFGFWVGTFSVSSFTNDLMGRFFRNGLLVLSLIIPVMAGLGLNFGIVVGALAGMLSIIFVRYHYTLFPGIGGLLLCFLIATPIAILFGFLTGKLYNKTRGQEMVASLIVGFFATGLYMIIVLFVIGGIIPVSWGHRMIIPGPEYMRPMGVRATFEMGLPLEEMTGRGAAQELPGMARALNNLWRVEFVYALLAVSVLAFLFLVIRRIYMRRNPASGIREPLWAFWVKSGICGAVVAFALYSSSVIYYWYNVLQNTP